MPEARVAAPVERAGSSPRKSRMRGSAIDTSRSRNSHIRAPRSVTFAPMGMPSRSLKLAIDLRARRTWARCPAIVVSSSIAAVERLRVGLRVADAHVERDLLDARHLHDAREAELVLEPRRAARRRRAPSGAARTSRSRPSASISWPQSARLQTRTRTMPCGVSFSLIPTRVGRLQVGQTTITFETGTAAAFSMIPPGSICGPPMRLAVGSAAGACGA